MDKDIVTFLKKYHISDNEIVDIMNIAPMLEYTSWTEFQNNCNLLVKYGYPRSDLDVLILSNPNIFSRRSTDLELDLIELSLKYDDIEGILKQDPFII